MITPYTETELLECPTFKVKGRFGGKWYLFETTTQFYCNGLVQQCEQLYEDGKCVECDPPEDMERVVNHT